jgi:hypothetical protein
MTLRKACHHSAIFLVWDIYDLVIYRSLLATVACGLRVSGGSCAGYVLIKVGGH